MANLRFSKRSLMLATEAGVFNSDVLALNPDKGMFVEIEVKVSKQDLLADFKKLKHEYYLTRYKKKEPFKGHRSYKFYDQFVPKQFFFCVPSELKDYALEVCDDLPYGVIVYHDSHISHYRRVKIIKRAKKLHNGPVPVKVIDSVLLRMSSELCNFHIKSLG